MSAPRARRSDLRFRKSDRLRRAADFRRVAKTGRREAGARFTVLMAPGVERGTRLGLTVPRQVGGAVVRNRLRRLVREYFRQNRSLFAGVSEARDVVVVPRAGVGWLGLADLSEIGALVERARSRSKRRSA